MFRHHRVVYIISEGGLQKGRRVRSIEMFYVIISSLYRSPISFNACIENEYYKHVDFSCTLSAGAMVTSLFISDVLVVCACVSHFQSALY